MRIKKTDKKRVRLSKGVRGWNIRKKYTQPWKVKGSAETECISLSLPPILNLYCLCNIFSGKNQG